MVYLLCCLAISSVFYSVGYLCGNSSSYQGRQVPRPASTKTSKYQDQQVQASGALSSFVASNLHCAVLRLCPSCRYTCSRWTCDLLWPVGLLLHSAGEGTVGRFPGRGEFLFFSEHCAKRIPACRGVEVWGIEPWGEAQRTSPAPPRAR